MASRVLNSGPPKIPIEEKDTIPCRAELRRAKIRKPMTDLVSVLRQILPIAHFKYTCTRVQARYSYPRYERQTFACPIVAAVEKL
jgi:hypothetical protein